MRKTLLQINVTSNWGSHGKIVEDIGALAMTKGWHSVIAYGRNENPSHSETIKIGSVLSVNEHVIESRLFDNHGLASRGATHRFIKKIDLLKPDIIHLHNIHGYYINYQLLFRYLKKKDIPVVWTLHDCWAFTGHCAYYDYVGCEAWRTGCCKPCPSTNAYPKSIWLDQSKKNWILKREAFNSVHNLTLVPVSIWLANQLNKSFLSHYPIRIIHNGVDIDTFKPKDGYHKEELRKHYELDGKKVLLGVANVWDERKGLNDYLKLSKMLYEDYRIVLIGLNDSQIKNLPSNVVGLSRTKNQVELAAWYSLADIVLNLSYEETFGMTTVEGFSCGTPSIVYDRTASPELAGSGTCLVAEAGNIDDVLRNVTKLGQKTLEVTTNCRKRAVEYYDKTKCFTQYVDLYEELLSQKK